MMILIALFSLLNAQGVKKIKLFDDVSDSLEAYDQQVYQLDLETAETLKDQQLIIALYPSIGTPKMAVDCDKQPKAFEFFEWQVEYSFIQQTTLTPLERSVLKCSDKKFFIAIQAEQASSYVIYTYVYASQLLMIWDIPYSGELAAGEILEFKIDPQHANRQITYKMLFGNSKIRAYIKRCNGVCSISKEEFGKSSRNGTLVSGKAFTFTHDEDECHLCYYLLGLMSPEKAPYRVEVQSNQTVKLLREGITQTEFMDKTELRQFKLELPKDDAISQIKVILTVVTGDALMYLSTNENPDEENHERKSKSEFIITNITSPYYLSVFSLYESSFSLYVQIHRKTTTDNVNFIQLFPSTQQSSTQSVDEFNYFKIDIEYPEQNITITNQILEGVIEMYVSSATASKEVPDSANYMWKGQSSVVIPFKEFKGTKQLLISVQKYTPTAKYVTQFTYSGDIYYLQIGEQTVRTIEANQWQYFQVIMMPEDLTISKTLYTTQNIDIYISLNQSNHKPSEQQSDYVLTGNQITIPAEQQLCVQDIEHFGGIKQCFVYIAVTTESTAFYALQTIQNLTLVRLFEGFPQTFQEANMTFIYTSKGFETLISLISLNVDCELLAWQGNLTDRKITYKPKGRQYQTYSITIPPSFESTYIQVIPSAPNTNETFTISISDGDIFIQESQPVTYTIQGLSYKYFRFEVKSGTALFINVITLDGDAFTFVSKSNETMPTLDEQQWGSPDGVVFIQSNSTFDIIGEYTVGVLAIEDSLVSVSYNTGQFRWFFMEQGYPYDFRMRANETLYFIYDENTYDTFKLMLSSVSGDLVVIIKEFEAENITKFEYELLNVGDVIIEQIIQQQEVFHIKSDENILIELYSKTGAHVNIELMDENNTITLKDSFTWHDELIVDERSNYRINRAEAGAFQITLYTGLIRVLVKEGDLEHEDEVDDNVRVNQTQVINFKSNNNKTQYTVRIIGLADHSSFSVTLLKSSTAPQLLHAGIPYSGIIQAQTTKKFEIVETTTKKGGYINIQLLNLNNTQADYNLQIVDSLKRSVTGLLEEFPRAMYYRIEQIADSYTLTLSSNQTIQYQLLMTEDQNILQNDIPFYDTLNLNAYRIFDVYVQEDSQVYLEAYTCGGKILLQATSNENNLANKVFEMQIQTYSTNHIQQILPLKKGLYYFAVKAIASVSKDLTYTIKQQQFKIRQDIPFQNFFINESIKAVEQNGNVYIYLPQVYNQSSYDSIHVILQVTPTPSDSLQCQFEDHYLNHNNEITLQANTHIYQQNQSNLTITLPYTEGEVYINAIAKVVLRIDNETEEFTYPYQSVHIQKHTTTSSHKWIWITLSISVLFILGLTIYVYKYKIGVQRLPTQENTVELNYRNFGNE